MPGPGERIGDAYIRVHASGEGIGDDLKRELADLDKDFDRAGKDNADAYENSLRRGMRKGGIEGGKEAVRGLRGTLREMKLIGEASGGEYFQGIRRTLLAEVKNSNIGNEMGRRIEEQFVRSGGRFSIVSSILGDSAQMTRIFSQAEDHINRLHADAIRMNKEFDSTGQILERSFKKTDFTVKFTRDVDRLGDVIGRVFGKGSRSEFLNFFGRLAGNLTKLAFLPLKVANGFVELTRSFIFAGTAAGGSLRGFARIGATFTQLGITLPAVIAGFAALGVAAGALLFIIGPLIAALSLLLGAVTALAASVSFALVGSLAALVALLGPLVAGLGVVGLAFIGMSKEAKAAVKEAFKPLAAEFQKLGAVARKGLFSRLPETVNQLKGAFTGLRPLVKEVSIAMADVGFSFAKAMNSPGFRRFRHEMFTFLPGAVRKLGEIFRHTLGGLGGLFVGMIPFMNDVLDALVRITRQFSEWANSAKGQKEIEGFFDRVKVSMKAVGGFLREVIGLIGDLFSAGRTSGDSLFTSMEKSVAQFRAFLKEDGGRRLRDWFADAEAFGRALGRLVIGIGKVIDLLDNSFTRSLATGFVSAIGALAKVLGSLDKASGGALGKNLGIIAAGIGGLAVAAKVVGGVKALATALGLLKAVGKVSVGVAVAEGAAGGAAAGAAAGGFAGLVARLKGRIAAAFKGLGRFAWKGLGAALVIDLAISFAQSVTGEGGGGIIGEIKAEVAEGKRIWEDFRAFLGIPVKPDVDKSDIDTADTAVQAMVNHYRDALNLPPLVFKTDATGLKALALVAGVSYATVRQLLGLPPIKPTVDDSQIKQMAASMGVSETLYRRFMGFPPLKPKADTSQLQRLGVSTLRQFNTLRALQGLPPIKPITDVSQLKTLQRVSGLSLKDLAKLGAFKKIKPLTDTGDIKKLMRETGLSRAALVKLGLVKARPKIDVTSNAKDAARRAQAAMNAVNSITRSITVFVNRIFDKEGGMLYNGIGFKKMAEGGLMGPHRLAMGGGMANFQQLYGNAIIGEAGREAVVPLDRPLSLVDPSVRALAAFAQGKLQPASSVGVDASGWTIVTPASDPAAVANKVLDRLTAAAY